VTLLARGRPGQPNSGARWLLPPPPLQGATQAQGEALLAGYQRLVGEDAMGSTYKALAIMQRGLPAPVGFEEQGPQGGAGAGGSG